ncbi:hypothetical protein [Desulfosudis oleivorans]|uniref:Uncharacterized protein n=1 Tax=Desulfosudis oleivorans (strain DSM 6200 / JCM 39069 / Hxd3) TaxID=96561 RepID=A8ZXC7_DESOH|nr:hypothetical protein [Desulfosudis oleivorans]ABW68506.1 hypothetical protein Dole_2703 [Desulfosudis oleivorans Hxd3]
MTKQHKKREYYVQEIKDIEARVIPVEGNLVELRHEQGSVANTIQQITKETGLDDFEEYIQEQLPEMSFRTIQRYMQIATYVDIKNHPQLCCLGTTRLLDLMAKEKDKDVVSILQKNKLKIPTRTATPDQQKQFRNKIDRLINRKKQKGGTGKKKKTDTVQEKGKTDNKATIVKQASAAIDLLIKHSGIIKKEGLYTELDLNRMQELQKRINYFIRHINDEA